jgi:hypothetical protein
MKNLKFCFLIFFLSFLVFTGIVEAGVTEKNEIRGIFVHWETIGWAPDWDVLCQTLADYNIDAIYGEFMSFGGGAYGDSPRGDQLGAAITACHARGIEVHVAMSFFYVTPDNHPELHAEDHEGNVQSNWICPCKQGTKDVIKNEVEYVANNYEIDGFMFDYIRYVLADMSYTDECRAEFQQWLYDRTGETINDWTLFHPGGTRYNEWMEWRIIPITETVSNVRESMLAIKPNLEFSAAVFTLYGYPPNYSPTARRYWLGQDTADWIGKGYLDIVAPMMYTTATTEPEGDCLDAYIDADAKYFTGGPEGKVPLIAFLTTGISGPVDESAFENAVNFVRSKDVDGIFIWRYGGPGDNSPNTIDITPYLSRLNMPDTFKMSNVNAGLIDDTTMVITWDTDLLTTSKVEYSTSPLFTSSYEYWGASNFNYWDVDHISGFIEEDTTKVTSHSIILSGLTKDQLYYYRVQSQDSFATATSKVYNFIAGQGPVTTTTSTTTIPSGQVTLSGQLSNSSRTLDVLVMIFNQASDQVNTSQSTSNGVYSLYVWPDVYDLQYDILHIPNFFIKLISLSITSNLQDVVDEINQLSNGVSFKVDITNNQEIQVYSSQEPISVKANGIELIEGTLPLQLDEWYYDSVDDILHMKVSLTSTTTSTTTIPVTTTTSTTTIPTSTTSIATTTTVPVTTTTTTIPGGHVFEDGFETGDFSAWDYETENEIADITITTSPTHQGVYAADCTHHGTDYFANAYLGKDLSSNYVDLYMRAHFQFESWMGDNLVLMGITNSWGATIASLSIRNHNSTHKRMYLRVLNESTFVTSNDYYIKSDLLNTWLCFEFHAHTADAYDGYVEFWVAGDHKQKITNLDNNGWGIANKIRIGMMESNQIAAHRFFFDDVVVSDTYIGC